MDVSRDREWKTTVDLSRVDEIGFTDLNRGRATARKGTVGLTGSRSMAIPSAAVDVDR